MLTKDELPDCPVATTVQLIGSKWKLLIMRKTVFPEVPPHVEYALSDVGESMRPILTAMQKWGENYKNSLV